MKVYPDPSIIIAANVIEPHSDAAATFLEKCPLGTIFVSWWTYTEVTSALGVKARVGAIDPSRRAPLLSGIRKALRAAAMTVTPVARDFEFASELMERTEPPLRGGDALHLAIADREALTLWTLDRKMAEAGQALGLDVHLLA